MIKTLWVGQLVKVNKYNLRAVIGSSGTWDVSLSLASKDPYSVIVSFGSIPIGYLPDKVSQKLLRLGSLADYTPAVVSYVNAPASSFETGLIGVNIKIETISDGGGNNRVPFDPELWPSNRSLAFLYKEDVGYLDTNRVTGVIDAGVIATNSLATDVKYENLNFSEATGQTDEDDRTKKLTATPRKIQA